MPPIQWTELFALTVSPVELFIRGTIIYLFIFVLMRALRREPGTVGIADLLMVVLIADASQNAMAGGYRSVLATFRRKNRTSDRPISGFGSADPVDSPLFDFFKLPPREELKLSRY